MRVLSFFTVIVLLQDECVAVRIEGFEQGMVAHTRYIAPRDRSRQAFELYSPRTAGGPNVVLHVQPRYDERRLIVATMVNGRWGGNGPVQSDFPITPGSNTTITIFANHTAFDIYANGGVFHHQSLFYPGTDNSQIDNVICWGGARAETVSVGKVLPKFGIGKVVYIYGRVPSRGSFAIDLLPTMPQHFNSYDTHFHMDVQFDQTPPTVVRNSYMSSRCCPCGSDVESDGVMPFILGENFIVTFIMQQYGFEVAGNGTHFTTYRYREPLREDMVVMVSGVPYLRKIEYF